MNLSEDDPARPTTLPSDSGTSVRRGALWPGLLLVVLGALGIVLLAGTFDPPRGLGRIDTPVLEWLAAHRIVWVTVLMTITTSVFGQVYLPVLVALLTAGWWWRTRRWREPAVVIAVMIVATVISSVLKRAFARPRPPAEMMTVPGVESSFSFPSGHVIGAATLVLCAGYMAWRLVGVHRRRVVLVWWLSVSAAVIVIVAFTRVYLGYHYVTDVLGGACAGVGMLGLVMVADRLWPTDGSG